MKPLTGLFIWLAELATLFLIYSSLCYVLPDMDIYSMYVEKFGFVIEEDWLDAYTLAIFTLSLTITSLLIWIIYTLCWRRKRH
jgi:hypothetical protein